YDTVYGDDETVAAAHQAMDENRGLLRREMVRGLNIRLVPTLELIQDTVPETAAEHEEVLRAAKARDAEIAAQRDSATYAGDEDPYKEQFTADAHPGLILVDKPAGWTSHDVVSRTRKIAGARKVGHAGTLDPMATGM